MPLIKVNKNLVHCHLFHQIIRTEIFADFFHFKIQFYLRIITLHRDIINYKFNTRVFDLKLIDPYS